MKNNYNLFLLFLIVGLLSITYVSSEDVTIGKAKMGDTIELYEICDNCSYVNLSNVIYPNKTFALNGQFATTKTGSTFNYSFSDTSTVGIYFYTMCGDLNGVNTCQTISFEVTKSGESNFGDIGVMFVYILFTIALVGNVVFLFLTIAKLATSNETLTGVLVSWGFFILMIVVNFLGKNYINSTFIESLSDLTITITTWSNGVLPLISLVVTMFVKGTQKKKPISIKDMTGGLSRYA